MRYALTFLLLVASTVQATEPFPIKAGNDSQILSPIDQATTDVLDGDKTIKVPSGMVYVPGGKFTFGRAEQVDLVAYCIGRFEVTNAEYKAFMDDSQHRGMPRYWKAGTYPEGKGNHPVLFVSLDDAEAYCRWVSSRTNRKIVVPSAQQWEKAARGPNAYQYPWGNQKDSHFHHGKLEAHFNYNAFCAAHMLTKEAKTITHYMDKSNRAGEEVTVDQISSGRGSRFSVTEDGNVTGWIDHSSNTGFVNTQIYRDMVDKGGFTTAVGSFPSGASHYGCYDMAGNAYEWTTTLITATNGAERGKQVNDIRGGSWYSTGNSGISLSIGEGRQRRGGYHSVGFRIAMEMEP